MFGGELVKYNYDSDNCARIASLPDTMLTIETRCCSRGRGNSNSVGLVPVSQRVDDVDVSYGIAHVPYNAERTPASSCEGGMVLTRGQSPNQDRLLNE